MSNYEWHPGRFLLWGFIALIAVIGTITAVGFLLRPTIAPYYPFGWGFFPFAPFFAFFWIIAIFWFVKFLFWPWRWGMGRRYWGYSRGYGYGDNAYYIIRERYARGEITKDQYDQMMRDLQQHSQAM